MPRIHGAHRYFGVELNDLFSPKQDQPTITPPHKTSPESVDFLHHILNMLFGPLLDMLPFKL